MSNLSSRKVLWNDGSYRIVHLQAPVWRCQRTKVAQPLMVALRRHLVWIRRVDLHRTSRHVDCAVVPARFQVSGLVKFVESDVRASEFEVVRTHLREQHTRDVGVGGNVDGNEHRQDGEDDKH